MEQTDGTPPNIQLVTADEICKQLGISKRTLAEYRRRRLIPFVKFSRRCVRFDPEAVRRAIGRLMVASAK